MPYQVKVNFVDAFESHNHPRAEVRPHLGKFVRKGTRVGTAVSVKQAVAGALQTLRNMPASAKVHPPKPTTEDTVDETVPPEPGTQPIPEGSVRRFHVTPAENVPAIRQHGLKMSSAKGIEGPRAIYSWTNHKDAQNYAGEHAAVVEFHHDPKNYEAHPYATTAEVPPENIVAIHEPWHQHYRTAKRDPTGKVFNRLGKIKGASYEKAYAVLSAEGTHDEACCDLCSAGELCDKHGTSHDAGKWDEGKHPRGQPDNPGQFSKGGSPGPSPHPSSKPQKEMHKIATGPGEAPEKVNQIQKVMKAYSVPKGGFAEKFGQQWIATLSEGVKEPAPAPPATPTAAPKAEHEGNVTQSFNKTTLPPSSLNGVPFQHWEAPKTAGAWNSLAGSTVINEPPLPKTSLSQGAGVIIQEDDGRVWIVHPTNAYGGYAATFPKGGVEKGLSLQATAMKEAYEESGLQVELTGFAGDITRTTSQARYYFAKRVGGTPVDAGWESEGVTLVPVEELFDHLNTPRDQRMANKFLGATQAPPMKLSDMKKTGGQLGSNPGGKYKAPNGKEYYVKFSKSDSHAKNELLASALYEAAGSPVLKAKLFDNDGKLATGTEWQSITPINRHDPKQREEAQKHFATHAWLANWDAAGLEYDNQGTAENGKMTTLDPGGSLLYRAQGGPKGNAFGDEVGEWQTLRDPNNKQSHTIYGSITPEQLKKSAARVGMVPDSIIHDLTMLHGPGDESQRKALAKRIINRKHDILKKAKALKVVPIPKTGDSLHHVMLRVRYGG